MIRIGDNLPSYLKVAAALLNLLGLALNLFFAMSPLWGWHPLLGWFTSIILVGFVWDGRRSIRAGLSRHASTADRFFAYFLLAAAIVALIVNIGIAAV